MPKIPIYTLAWLPARVTYELYETHAREALPIALESPAWFAWLESVSSFAFVGKSCRYTVRKEAKPGGRLYWYAYLARGDHLCKKYVGKTSIVTLARLEEVAESFSLPSESDHQPVQQPSDPSTRTRTSAPLPPTPASMPAQQRYPLYPLLVTKLTIPRLRMQLVPRTHLIEQLQQCTQAPVTLISAPAGFGKTTLLAQWLCHCDRQVAWLSLEAEDNNPVRFLSYIIAAIQMLAPGIGDEALALLRPLRPPSPEMVFAMLANDIVAHYDRELILVLDDYHIITSDMLHQSMVFLLEHLPPQLHLILVTRTDPPLPLARLRACGHLAEMRSADLRFANDEVHMFLQTAMGLDLPSETVTMLEQRTEGWVAGLQMAALSLQGREGSASFPANVTGTHHFVLDYLSEEVLMRQPPSMQEFLLSTSILDRFSASLCDAVTGREGSQEMLEKLEKANLFVVALDGVRGWYRYHHLFVEALRSHLQQWEPERVAELHRRASAWYESHELPLDAVQHALAIPDEGLAIRLVSPVIIPCAFQDQRFLVLRWLNALPETAFRTHPLLCTHFAALLLVCNQFGAAYARLQQAEREISADMPEEHVRLVRGYVLADQAVMITFNGDTLSAIPLAHQALALLPETDKIARPGSLAVAMRACLLSGDVTPTSERRTAEAEAAIPTLENPFAAAGGTGFLAYLYKLQGRLHQAAATYAQMRQVFSTLDAAQAAFSIPYYCFGLGHLLREWNDLEAAEQHLRQGMAYIHEEVIVEPWVAIQGYTALARVRQARGDSSEASIILNSLIQLAQQRRFAAPGPNRIDAERARLALSQGNLAVASFWAETCGLSPTDTTLPYPRESEYLILARVYITQARQATVPVSLQDVLLLLDRLLKQAEKGARVDSVLEILAVRALALSACGELEAALRTLERALQLAEPEGYVRTFIDEGVAMQTLLRQLQSRGVVVEYVTTLLNALGTASQPTPLHDTDTNPLTEPLTEREREVLSLLLEGASNREIASQLILSVNTVKRHVYNLCSKLGVRSRMQVICQARSLNLF